MIPIHLRINYGGEERFDLVRKTVEVSASYFKTIRIANFGPDENSIKFTQLLIKYPHLSVANLGSHFHACITEDLMRHHVMDIPDGEWVIFLDSDWRLPQIFLDKMQTEVELCESEGYNAIFSYQLGHTLDDRIMHTEYGDKCFNYDSVKMKKVYEAFEKKEDRYGWPLVQKVDKNNLWIDSFFGNHVYYLFAPYKKKIVPEMYHLHFRHFDDWAYCSTMLYQSWWYIGHNVFPKQDHIDILNSKEYINLNKFKEEHKCYTANQLRLAIKNPEFLEQLRLLFLSFENSIIFGCKQMYMLAHRYNMQLWTTPNESLCNGLCCKYNQGQIYHI